MKARVAGGVICQDRETVNLGESHYLVIEAGIFLLQLLKGYRLTSIAGERLKNSYLHIFNGLKRCSFLGSIIETEKRLLNRRGWRGILQAVRFLFGAEIYHFLLHLLVAYWVLNTPEDSAAGGVEFFGVQTVDIITSKAKTFQLFGKFLHRDFTNAGEPFIILVGFFTDNLAVEVVAVSVLVDSEITFRPLPEVV